MKHINILLAVLVLTCFAFTPAAVRADEELDDHPGLADELDLLLGDDDADYLLKD